jgi:hypothetical protein
MNEELDRWCRPGVHTEHWFRQGTCAVHDWDSLTAGPEAWVVGAASV